jgi:hypothetical protein
MNIFDTNQVKNERSKVLMHLTTCELAVRTSGEIYAGKNKGALAEYFETPDGLDHNDPWDRPDEWEELGPL